MAADRTLHLPYDFELTEGVRLLSRCFGEDPGLLAVAAVYVIRLWVDAARNRADWRALKRQTVSPECADRHRLQCAEVVWSEEPLAGLIESACGYEGKPGELIHGFFEAGLLSFEWRDDVLGVLVVGFALDNKHLLSDFKSIQQLGGEAKAAKQRVKDAGEAVGKLVQAQPEILFVADTALNPEQQKAAASLIARIDVACNLPVRRMADFKDQAALLETAYQRSKRSTETEIQEMLGYLMKNVDNPRVPKDAETIFRDWERLSRFSRPATDL